MSTDEIRNLISTCKVHVNQIETFLALDQPAKAEFRANELREAASRLRNVLFYVQRRSGEVSK